MKTFKILDSFMKENDLLWNNYVKICTDGILSMVGSIKGLTALAKKNEKITLVDKIFICWLK